MILKTSTMHVGRAGHYRFEHHAPLLLGLPSVHHVPPQVRENSQGIQESDGFNHGKVESSSF